MKAIGVQENECQWNSKIVQILYSVPAYIMSAIENWAAVKLLDSKHNNAILSLKFPFDCIQLLHLPEQAKMQLKQ